MKKLNLHLFDDPTYTCTVYKDGGYSAAAASATSGLSKDDEVTLSWTLSSGYELAEIEQVKGTVEINMTTKKFAMPASDVVLYFKSKKDNLYIVTEECTANCNNTKTVLHKNMVVSVTPNGVAYAISSDGTEVTVDGAIQQLIDTGVLQKI